MARKQGPHITFRVVTTNQSDHKLLQMFADSFNRMNDRTKAMGPAVISQ